MLNSGVYLIINLVSNKVYVGSSVKIKNRWKEHQKQLQANSHHNSHLQSAFNTYGSESFIYEIVELTSVENRLEAEQFWIDNLKVLGCALYNFRPVSETPGKSHSIETLKHLKVVATGRVPSVETRLKISQSLKGRVISNEHRLKLLAIHTGSKRSEETRTKMRMAKLGSKASESAKEKMRNKIVSDETKAKMKNRIYSEDYRAKCKASQKIRREREANHVF